MATPRRFGVAEWAICAITGSALLCLLLYALPRGPALTEVEQRAVYHEQQLEFQRLWEQNKSQLIGAPIGRAVPVFGPLETSAILEETYSWKRWPCRLLLKEGRITAAFFNDFPYKSQTTPPDPGIHSRPYFERHPDYLTGEFIGGWDESGKYRFKRK